MGKYQKGDHVKIEVKDEQFGIGEWMWMLVGTRAAGTNVYFFDSVDARGIFLKRYRLLGSRLSCGSRST